jgi:phosphatidylethanolamine-binding protein (PEBP) family uncharacterized protein
MRPQSRPRRLWIGATTDGTTPLRGELPPRLAHVVLVRLMTAVMVGLTAELAGGHPWHRHEHAAVPNEDHETDRDAAHDPTERRNQPSNDTVPAPVGGPDASKAVAAFPFRFVADRPRRQTAEAIDITAAFAAFQQRGSIACRQDDRWFYVESNGIPDHPLMVGIRNWQQQVPLPQPYSGSNAWQIPLHPMPAAQPRTARNAFLRGAIAVAVNGIPIFNPLNNRGEDASAIGELDTFGGHCGRADDYHYHLPPVHLEQQVGRGMPIAYALDGYPIYGLTEPDGSPPRGLDALNGHETAGLGYHYHATKAYPYLNGGFHGEVVERDGQVDPQPRAQPLREALPPLPGARIVAFSSPQPDTRRLVYEIAGRRGSVEYTLARDGAVQFTSTDPAGRVSTEEARPRGGPGGGRPKQNGQKKGGNRKPGGPAAGKRPGPDGAMRQPGEAAALEIPRRDEQQTRLKAALVVTSPAIAADGRLPPAFTCDGAGISPPVTWTGAPAGTRSFALSLWHESPDGVKSYWVVHGIPSTMQALPAAARGIGVEGLNDRRRSGYEPMCSQGPGAKTYHLTIYALGEMPPLPTGTLTREQMLAAIANAVLAEGTLSFTYTRKGPL